MAGWTTAKQRKKPCVVPSSSSRLLPRSSCPPSLRRSRRPELAEAMAAVAGSTSTITAPASLAASSFHLRSALPIPAPLQGSVAVAAARAHRSIQETTTRNDVPVPVSALLIGTNWHFRAANAKACHLAVTQQRHSREIRTQRSRYHWTGSNPATYPAANRISATSKP
jgi:hypothetical protein